jgi:outer membrane protein
MDHVNYRFSLLTLSVFLVAASLLFMTPLAAESAETLVLEKVLELSKTGNPLLLAADSRVKKERGRLVQAQSYQAPRLTATLGYQRLDEIQNYYVFDINGKNRIGIVPMEYENTYQAALTLEQVIYSGGTIQAQIQAQKLVVAAREAERDRVAQSISNGVRVAYFALQRAASREHVSAEALSLAEEHLRQVEIFYRTGLVAKNEVLRVQVDVSSARLNHIRATSDVKVAWKQLERVTGHSLETQYKVPPGDFELEEFNVSADPLSRAMEMRPELKSLAASEKAARKMVQAIKGSYLPQLGLAVEGRAYDEKFFPSQKEELRIKLQANFKIMDSGETHGQIVEQQAAAEELLYNMEDMKREIALDVSKAQVNMDAALQRVQVAQDGILQAEEDYRMALKRYQSKVGTNIDVLDARLALIDTRNAKIDAIAEARTAYADLLYATGEI